MGIRAAIDSGCPSRISGTGMLTHTGVAARASRRFPDRATPRVLAPWFALLVLLGRQPRAAHAADGTSVRLQPRIVNGTLTPFYPTTGALLFGDNPADVTDVSTECSGVLVGCQTVLTAAHCVCPE